MSVGDSFDRLPIKLYIKTKLKVTLIYLCIFGACFDLIISKAKKKREKLLGINIK